MTTSCDQWDPVILTPVEPSSTELGPSFGISLRPTFPIFAEVDALRTEANGLDMGEGCVSMLVRWSSLIY